MTALGWPTPGGHTLNLTGGSDRQISFQLRDTNGDAVNFPAGEITLQFPTIDNASYGVTSPSSGSVWRWTIYGSVATITVPSAVVNLIPNNAPWYLVWNPAAQARIDAVGAGSTGSSTTPSFTHTINGNAIVLFCNIVTLGSTPGTVTATCGGVSMTALASVPNYYAISPTDNNVSMYAFGLINPPTGNQTVAMTFTDWGSKHQIAANSLSYFNVSTFGTPVADSGPGETTIKIMSAENRLVANAFSGYTGGFSSYSQALRYRFSFVNGDHVSMIMGDAPIQDIANQPALVFTSKNTSAGWGGIAVPMVPKANPVAAGYAISSGLVAKS